MNIYDTNMNTNTKENNLKTTTPNFHFLVCARNCQFYKQVKTQKHTHKNTAHTDTHTNTDTHKHTHTS